MDMSKVSEKALRERYEARFDDVLLLPLELLRTEPGEYLTRLADFIGINLPPVDLSPIGSARTQVSNCPAS